MNSLITLSRRLFEATAIGAVLLFCGASHAATVNVETTIIRTLVADEGRWGGCMALTSTVLATAGLDCPSQWVTFSCAGPVGGQVYTTKDIAYRMFESAQLSLVLDKRVMLRVTDEKKHSGFCYANRIDLIK